MPAVTASDILEKIQAFYARLLADPHKQRDIVVAFYQEMSASGTPEYALLGLLLTSIWHAQGAVQIGPDAAAKLVSVFEKIMSDNRPNVTIHAKSIGNVNLGQQLGNVKAVAKTLEQGGHREIAAALQELATAIADDKGLKEPQQQEALAAIQQLGQEAKKADAERTGVTIKSLLAYMPGVLAGAEKALGVWEKVSPIIKAFFGS